MSLSFFFTFGKDICILLYVMKDTEFTVKSLRNLTGSVYELVLDGDTSDFSAPGQFVEISVPGLFLRRPISVCDWNESSLTLLVKDIGAGTSRLHHLQVGSSLQVITGLGNGFDVNTLNDAGKTAVLVGGGIGIAPLYALARILKNAGKTVKTVLGFRNADEVFYTAEFGKFGDVYIATEDGSVGTKGFVTDVIKQMPDCGYVYACGPMPMLKAVVQMPQVTGGQFSFEARMGCGFGACVGCTIKTVNGPKRVCKEGPVFQKEEIVW